MPTYSLVDLLSMKCVDALGMLADYRFVGECLKSLPVFLGIHILCR